MKYFPIFLDLETRPVVLVGGGEEVLRKARLFGKTTTRLKVIATRLHDELAAMPNVDWVARRFDATLLEGAALVCAADPAWNTEASAAAQVRGIPVNVVDHPELSTFLIPSIVDRDPVVVAIGTEGTAPVLGQGLRARIDALLPQNLGALARAGAALRAIVSERIAMGSARRSFWHRFFFGDVREAHLAGDTPIYTLLVNRLLDRHTVAAQGRVTFVAAGQADPDLLTLKAQRKLQEADVILHDGNVPPAILELARRDATRMRATGNFVRDTETQAELASAGRLVVRLTLTESPTEELANLAAEGIAVETVPGVGHRHAATIVPFPVREDLRDALLRAAS